MNEEFVNDVRKALEWARKLQFRELGQLRRLTSLKLIENRMLSSPERSAVYFGKAIADLLWEIIDTLEPSFPENVDTPAWRIYIILRDYIKRGEEWTTVADRLGIAAATFQEAKRRAGELTASTVWSWEEKSRLAVIPRDNLPSQSFIFAKYVERHNEFEDKPIIAGYKKDEKLTDILIELLKGRPWIISLDGLPGVGKTSLAYEVGRQCKERGLFEAVIWASAKKRFLVVKASSFAQTPFVEPVTSCEDILDTIAHVLEYRAVSGLTDLTEKLNTVSELLRDRNCLIIVDNLEEFAPDALDHLSIFLWQYKGPSKVLLTSRRVMNIGERPLAIPGLSFDEASKLMKQECALRSMDLLTEKEEKKLYEATRGLPLAINLIIGLMKSTAFSVQTAIEQFIGNKVVLDFMWGEAYKQLGEDEKQVLHVFPIFALHSASEKVICSATQLYEAQVVLALGTLHNLNFVSKSNSRYKLHGTSVYEFLEGLEDVTVGKTTLAEFTGKAYANLAKYYIKILEEKPTIDQKLEFLREGEGDEKRIILRTLQGCRTLADADLKIEGCRSADAWHYIVDLFDLMGHPLGVLWYVDERFRWGEQAIIACQILGKERKGAWFHVFDIGRMHLNMGNEQKAEEIFTENLALAKERGYKEVEALVLHNLGWMAREKGEVDKAVDLFNRALDLWSECEPQYEKWKVITMSACGLAKCQQAQDLEGEVKESTLSEALVILTKALKLHRGIGHLSEVVEGLSEVALAYAALGRWTEAWQSTEQALELSEKLRPPSVTYAYALHLRAKVWEYSGNIEKAKADCCKASQVYKDVGAKYRHSIVESYRERLERISD